MYRNFLAAFFSFSIFESIKQFYLLRIVILTFIYIDKIVNNISNI